jgi:hypothetical protein
MRVTGRAPRPCSQSIPPRLRRTSTELQRDDPLAIASRQRSSAPAGGSTRRRSQMHGYQPSGRHCCFHGCGSATPSVRAPPGACSSFRAGVLGVVVKAPVCTIGGRYGGERRREAVLRCHLPSPAWRALGTAWVGSTTSSLVPHTRPLGRARTSAGRIMRLGMARAACRVRVAARCRAGPCGRWPK